MREKTVSIYPTEVTPLDEIHLLNAADRHMNMAVTFAAMEFDMISNQEVAKAFAYGALASQVARCLELSSFIGADTAIADLTAPELLRVYNARNDSI